MSRRKTNSTMLDDRQEMTEEEFQEKWKDHPSPLVQFALAARRERIRRGEPLLDRDDINREVARRRYGDDGEAA